MYIHIYIYIMYNYLSLSLYIYTYTIIQYYTHIFLHAFNYMETDGHVNYLGYLYVPLQWQVFLPNMVSASAASGISPQRPMLAEVEKICGAFSAARFTTNFCSLFGASSDHQRLGDGARSLPRVKPFQIALFSQALGFVKELGHTPKWQLSLDMRIIHDNPW